MLEKKSCAGLFGCIFLVTSIFYNSLGEGDNRNLWPRRLFSDDITKPLSSPINNPGPAPAVSLWPNEVTALGIQGWAGAGRCGGRSDSNSVMITQYKHLDDTTPVKGTNDGYFQADPAWGPLRRKGRGRAGSHADRPGGACRLLPNCRALDESNTGQNKRPPETNKKKTKRNPF